MKKEEPEQNTSNQAVQTTDDHQADKLTDLPVTEEQAEQTKGGVKLYRFFGDLDGDK